MVDKGSTISALIRISSFIRSLSLYLLTYYKTKKIVEYLKMVRKTSKRAKRNILRIKLKWKLTKLNS